MTGSQYIKAMRLFQTEPKWAALNRSDETEKNPVRMDYVRMRKDLFPKVE